MKMATTATKYCKSKELSRMEAKMMLAIVLSNVFVWMSDTNVT